MMKGNKALLSLLGSKRKRLNNSIFTFTVGSARATAKLGIGQDVRLPKELEGGLDKEVLEHQILM